MIQHLIKMIWNKKKQNFLLIMEIFVSFLVLFGVFSVIVFNIRNYNKPRGFKDDNVWSVTFTLEDRKDDSIGNYEKPVNALLRSMPEVEELSWTSENFPFAMSSSNNQLSYNKVKVSAEVRQVEDTYLQVISATMKEGRWFGKQDDGLKVKPIVINETLKERLFKNESPIGKIINADEENGGDRVVGVFADFKERDDFQEDDNSFYRRITPADKWHAHSLLMKLRSRQDANFEAKIHKELSKLMKNANIEIEYLTEKRITRNKLTVVPIIILLLVCGFLVLNVSLGIFGILWYNINKRRSEIGLRRAVGATSTNISAYFIAEAMVLTSMALLIGLFFAIQFPLLNIFDVSGGVYLKAIIIAVLFIYVLVLVCAFYPGKQAANIYPAVALHEE